MPKFIDMECCINDLGRFPHNKAIDTGIPVTVVGDYILMMEGSNGNTFELVKTIEEAGNIMIAVGDLNENMDYKFTIEDPDGDLISVNECSNFKLKTILNTQINGCDNGCDDSDDSSSYYS